MIFSCTVPRETTILIKYFTMHVFDLQMTLNYI